MEQDTKKEEKKKGLFARWIKKMDKKMEAKSKKTSCCGGDDDKGSSCC